MPLCHRILVIFLALSYCSTLPLISILHSHNVLTFKTTPVVKNEVSRNAEDIDHMQNCDICSRLQSTHGFISGIVSSHCSIPVLRRLFVRYIGPDGFILPSTLQGRAPPIILA